MTLMIYICVCLCIFGKPLFGAFMPYNHDLVCPSRRRPGQSVHGGIPKRAAQGDFVGWVTCS